MDIDLSQEIDDNRKRLRHYVQLHLDARVRGRVDASDVVQEACLEAARRLDYYRQLEGVPFYLWLRGLARDHLIAAQRKHLGAQARDVRREVRPQNPEVTSVVLADVFVARSPTASQVAMEAEGRQRLEQVLEELGEMDREIVAMRHFEELSNREIAEALGMTEAAASVRYVRALKKLSQVISFEG